MLKLPFSASLQTSYYRRITFNLQHKDANQLHLRVPAETVWSFQGDVCETHQSVDPQSDTAESQQASCQQQCLCRCDTFDANMFSDRKRKELRKWKRRSILTAPLGCTSMEPVLSLGLWKGPVTETLAMWSGHSSTEISLISSSSSSSTRKDEHQKPDLTRSDVS